MAWQKPTPQKIEAFERALPDDASVERKRVLVREHRARPFEPLPGRVMKGWLVVPQRLSDDRRSLAKWTARAFTHTSTLPAKIRKAAKRAK